MRHFVNFISICKLTQTCSALLPCSHIYFSPPLCCSDHKGSPFENKTIERTLSVEICGTPGKQTWVLLITNNNVKKKKELYKR